jgi:hypothetical protein
MLAELGVFAGGFVLASFLSCLFLYGFRGRLFRHGFVERVLRRLLGYISHDILLDIITDEGQGVLTTWLEELFDVTIQNHG